MNFENSGPLAMPVILTIVHESMQLCQVQIKSGHMQNAKLTLTSKEAEAGPTAGQGMPDKHH